MKVKLIDYLVGRIDNDFCGNRRTGIRDALYICRAS